MSNTELTTRILAIALALFLWAYVRIVHETPDAQRIIQNVPVTITGKPAAGLMSQLHVDNRTIDVRIRGPLERINGVDANEVKAQVDVSAVNREGTRRLPVNLVLPAGVYKAQQPADVTIITRALTQQKFPVTVSFITSPPPGTSVGEYLIQPSTVTVEGPQEVVEKVKYVTISIDPSEPMHAKRTLIPRARSIDGDLLEDVHLLESAVDVRLASMTGQQVTREVAVRPPDLHNPPRRFTVTAVKVRPDVVTLSGESAVLDKQPAYLETDPLDVHAVTRDMTVTAHIRVPRGVTIVEGSDVRVDLQANRIGK